MSVSREMRAAVGALMARYNCGSVSPEFMTAFRQTFNALSDQVEEMENAVVPSTARGIPPDDLPPNVVSLVSKVRAAHLFEGERP
jgi:hypothetical protein